MHVSIPLHLRDHRHRPSDNHLQRGREYVWRIGADNKVSVGLGLGLGLGLVFV